MYIFVGVYKFIGGGVLACGGVGGPLVFSWFLRMGSLRGPLRNILGMGQVLVSDLWWLVWRFFRKTL